MVDVIETKVDQGILGVGVSVHMSKWVLRSKIKIISRGGVMEVLGSNYL